MYFKEHRELELVRTELQQTTEEHQRSIEDAKEEHRAAIEEAEARNRRLQELIENDERADRLRRAERENAELLLRQRQLLDEASDLRSAGRPSVSLSRAPLQTSHGRSAAKS